ncbi:MAG TPA: ABC transporter substrate-binding protein [Burkholderiales bacterium]|nr:ABC transporter substrate-binding protein [Burkholderiales bacterium]
MRYRTTTGLLVALAILVVLVVVALILAPSGADLRAPKRTRPFLIGALNDSWGPTPQVAGLRDGLLELGYRESEQFVIGVRFTRGDLAALPAAARQLVQDGVDVIFADHDDAAKAAQQVTTQVPIVFAMVGDPVGLGLIHTFAHPGGNITGVADLHLELGPKRLEVFREIVPNLHRVLFPYYATDVYAKAEARELRIAARRLGIELVERALHSQEEAQAALAAVQRGEVDGILAPRCCALNISGFVLEATSRLGMPTMFEGAFWVERGALAGYGQDLYVSGHMAARLVDKILKGASPAEIPVEVNAKLEYVINVKVANALGLTIPRDALYRADRLIQ